MTKKSGYVGAQMGGGRNMHHKSVGSENQKKGFIAISVMLLGILVLLVSLMIAPAMASDWPQFQSDKTNTGIANEKILGRSVAWSVYAHSDPWNMAGIDAVPIVADGNVYVLDAPGYICSFDATTGAENEQEYYNIPTGPPYYQLSTPAYGDGKIFFGLSSGGKKGHVFAVNADDVTDKVWERTINESEQINTPITYENSMIYFGTWDGTVDRTYSGTYYCLDATNGNNIWNYTAGADNGYYWTGACIIDDYIIFGSDLGIVTCLDKSTGALMDEENLADVASNAGQIRSSVTCNMAGSRVYFSEAYIDGGSIGGRVWAYDFNSATGNLSYAWHCSLNTASKTTPVVYNGRVYVGDGSFQANGRLYCIYESNGTIEWYYTVSGNNGAGSPGIMASPVISAAGNELYIYFTTNCENGRLYCINEIGEMCWYYEPMESTTSGEYILQGVSVYSNGGDMRVFFGNDAGMLYALDDGMCGDVDANGEIRTSDAQKVWKRAVSGFYLDSPWAADVDCNGEIRASDAQKVWKRAVDLGFVLHCCCDA